MKKMYILALAALALAFSCNKTAEVNAPEETSQPQMRTVTCIIADPDSKVAISTTNGKTTWEVDDEILFHGKYTGESSDVYSVVIKLTSENISADGKSFTVTLPAFVNGADQAKWASSSASYSKSNVFAAYPASAITVDNGSNNWYNKNIFNESNLPLMSAYNDDYDSNTFVFNNLTGILSFVVTGDYDGYTLKGNNGETVAYTGYTSRIFKKTNNTINEEWVYAGTPLAQVSGTVTSGKETRICIPNGVTFSTGFTILLKKGEDIVKELKTTEEVVIARNAYRPMGDVTTYLKDYVPDTPPATNHYKDLDVTFTSATALDGTESANSYIITSNGTYKFKAVEGNDTATELTTIASVEVLWETQNTASAIDAGSVIASADYHYKSGETPYIVFSTPGTLKAGNALIAAKDDHNDIIWSWHIWIPSTTINNVDAGFAGTNAIMDRNLGALEVTPAAGLLASNGLYYQWGRKDPLCGTHIKGSVSLTTTVASQAASMAVSIKNPTTFYYVESSDWCAVGDANRWDNAGAKTKYDPCPPGYKVPGYNSSLPMWNKSGAKFSGDGVNWSYTQDQSCKYNTATTAFPLPGYVNGNGQSESGYGKRELVWSSKAYDSNRGNCMLIRENAYNAEKQAKSSGGNVRCIVE